MLYIFLVEVETDDNNVDAPDADWIKDEIESNLEFDTPGNGFVAVRVVHTVAVSDRHIEEEQP